MSAALAIGGASIFLLLGLAHFVFTLMSSPERGPMMPLDADVLAAMQIPGGLGLAPDIRTTLFKAWIGFNLSHSIGIIAIAGIVITRIASGFADALDDVWFLVLVGVAPLAYLVLAVKYWFDKPRDGIALGTALLWAGVLLELL